MRSGGEQADGIDAGVRVEALVLDGQHGLLHPRRDGGQRHVARFSARAVGHQRRQQRRVELDRLHVAAAADFDLLNAAGRRWRRAADGRRLAWKGQADGTVRQRAFTR